jgi:hypothetical protein
MFGLYKWPRTFHASIKSDVAISDTSIPNDILVIQTDLVSHQFLLSKLKT